MRKLFFSFALLIFLAACSEEAPKNKIFAIHGVAIDGYDPVAYFESGEAILGDPSLRVDRGDVTYHFLNGDNQLLFEKNPEKYLPAYGGWCAYAIAENNTKMQPDPTLWKIQDGKLLLFYDDWTSKITGSLLEEWETQPEEYEEKADANWSKMHP
ncbi:YHS domain-containing (seleno)protein [Reichenbachiella ulvae]|uniref:YHS domain protein n=1 Tax=Reichenbachiella ulvae TaxID=2980104 RepID=A0ABT3CYE5_9BACT|nr:YHS domain-containing (seleno)protein [Reichenbachiella ulvae]MCV9388591.1 YHS domain protein [Reichenbachiella ulvae]